MAEPLLLEVSPSAAALVAPDVPLEVKLQTARGEVPGDGADLAAVLYYLCHDPDTEVSTTARITLRELGDDRLAEVVAAPGTHPRILDILARLHFGKRDIAWLIAQHPAVSQETLEFLAVHGVQGAVDILAVTSELEDIAEEAEDTGELPDEDVPEEEIEPEEEVEENEEFRSKYQLAQTMGVAEKVKVALTGDKEWRSIMIKDSNKMVSGSVMKNPRITDAEILTIAKLTGMNEEIIRAICVNKEWVKKYPIRKALVENNKTPLPFALRFMASLGEKDVAALAKSKNVSTVIATQARRLLMNKKKD